MDSDETVPLLPTTVFCTPDRAGSVAKLSPAAPTLALMLKRRLKIQLFGPQLSSVALKLHCMPGGVVTVEQRALTICPPPPIWLTDKLLKGYDGVTIPLDGL